MQTGKIRVLLVDDSMVAINILMKILQTAPDIEVVGTAHDGKEAMKLMGSLRPSVVCTDFHMPGMSGLELVKNIMHTHPCPVLVVSVSVEQGSSNAFKLLEAGALDIVAKPSLGDAQISYGIANELLSKIRILAGVRVFKRNKLQATAVLASAKPPPLPAGAFLNSRLQMVVIGASTGGPQALQTVLGSLPFNYPVPIVCVQHISDGFLNNLVSWLAANSALKCQLAQAGETPKAGTVYFPQERTHLKFDPYGRFLMSLDPPYKGHCPSVNVTMQSAAQCYGAKMVAVLLTGMGDDGAQGMRAVSDAGGVSIAQDEASCVVFGMPKQAIQLGAAKRVLGLNDIASNLVGLCQVEA